MGLVEDLTAAWNAHDAERTAALYAEDGVREEFIVTHMKAAGRAEIAGLIQMYLEAMPDLALSMRHVSSGDGVLTLEWMVHATHTGDAEGWPANNEAVAFPGVSVLEVAADGTIREERVYTDFTGLLAGAGLIPGLEPPMWG
jgi:steroid delta-isomerase-like uncharacterized protein